MTTLRATLLALSTVAAPAFGASSTHRPRPIPTRSSASSFRSPPAASPTVSRAFSPTSSASCGSSRSSSKIGRASPGTTAVAKSAPDGYTLMLTSNGHTIASAINKNIQFDPVKDFAGVTRVAVGAAGRDRPARLSGQDAEGFHRPGKREAGQAQLLLGRGCQHLVSVGRDAQAGRQDQHPARALQGRARGHDRRHPRRRADVLRADPGHAGAERNAERSRRSPSTRPNAFRNCRMCRPSRRPCRTTNTNPGSACSRRPGRRSRSSTKVSEDIAKVLEMPDVREKLAGARLDSRAHHAGGVRRHQQGRHRALRQDPQGRRHYAAITQVRYSHPSAARRSRANVTVTVIGRRETQVMRRCARARPQARIVTLRRHGSAASAQLSPAHRTFSIAADGGQRPTPSLPLDAWLARSVPATGIASAITTTDTREDTMTFCALQFVRCRRPRCRAANSSAPPRPSAVAASTVRRRDRRGLRSAQQPGGATAPGRAILIKGGCVLTLDRAVGDFEQADVLIEGGKISAVRPNISAPNAEVIDAARMIVMPGFVDTHRHMWQGILRNVLPDGSLEDYRNVVQRTFGAKIYARRRLCRRSVQRARRHRQRRDLRARLVAHPEHAGAHRRRGQGLGGVRACARSSPMAPRRTRPAGSGRCRDIQISRRHRAPAQAVFLQRRSTADALSGGAVGVARGDPARSSRPRATSAPASPSMSASASSAAMRCSRSSTRRRR